MQKRNKTYGLIGKTLGHSFSQKYFSQKFEAQGSDETYENFELENIQLFPELIASRRDLCGLNVTIPYKESIIPFLDELSEEARAIGAVNTIKIEGEKLIGYNTDAFGFHQSIKPFLKGDCHRALILGTGGASKAVAYVLKGLGIDCFFISREPKGEFEYGYDAINQIMMNSMGLIVNTTPVGTYPKIDEAPDIPYHLISSKHHVYDLIYNPEKTKFLELAEKQGASIQNGYQMLIHQAEKAYQIWDKD
ncbi:MAG: shikimate dehydrogenase [Crocinitomicaceae bacterium]|nr:shikimate dehydrogenase [Crocinitomicaceae bacterium]